MVYTVTYSSEQYDIPVRAFSDRGEAEKYAAELYEFYLTEDDDDVLNHHADVENAIEVTGEDGDTFAAIQLYTFDANGLLVSSDVIGVDADDDTQLQEA
jgi:hypothetical protein